jgi:hypothetical protein
MLQILRSPRLAPSSEVLQEDIGRAIREDEGRFNKFSRDSARARRLEVPGPTKVRPAAHKPAQDDETIPEENAALDEMCQTAENALSSLFAKKSVNISSIG